MYSAASRTDKGYRAIPHCSDQGVGIAAENCCPLQEDVKKLERALEQATGDIDILLTCEWPADVTAATPPGSAPAEVSMPGQPSLT